MGNKNRILDNIGNPVLDVCGVQKPHSILKCHDNILELLKTLIFYSGLQGN